AKNGVEKPADGALPGKGAPSVPSRARNADERCRSGHTTVFAGFGSRTRAQFVTTNFRRRRQVPRPREEGSPRSRRSRSGPDIRRAAKPEVAGGTVRGVGRPGGDAIARAVRVVAEVASAAHHPRLAMRRADRVAAGLVPFLTVPVDAPPVGAPFPDVSRHLVEAETVRGIG